MTSTKFYSMTDAVEHFLDLFTTVGEDEFKLLYFTEYMKIRTRASKQMVKLQENAGDVVWQKFLEQRDNAAKSQWAGTNYSPEQLEIKLGEYRADQAWEEWNKSHGNLVMFWSWADGRVKEVIINMIEAYAGENYSR